MFAWPHGDLYVLESLWKRLGMDAVIRVQAKPRRFGFNMERA